LQPFAGVFVDRFDRRTTLFFCDLARAGLVLLIPLVIIKEHSLGLLYATVLAIFCFSRFYVPAKMSIIPDIVTKDNLFKANSLITTTGMIATALGAAVGALDDPEVEISGTIEVVNHPDSGKDIGELLGREKTGVKIVNSLSELSTDGSPALIEFTSPEATMIHLKWALGKNVKMVIGTTAISDAQQAEIKKASAVIPICFAPNMSVGVNLLFNLTEQAAKVLSKDYDVEIVEAHHRFKKDSPSGTAKRLAEIVAKTLDRDLEKDGVYGRKGIVGERKDSEIGIHSVRAGDIVGEHTVSFTTLGERIELTHKAHSRNTFALGAIRAVKFLSDKQTGIFSMADVLGL